MSALRTVTGAVGVALVGYGGWLVLSGGRATDLLSVLVFVAVPVVVHDGLIAPAVVIAGWICARHVPATARAPLQAALVVGASLTLVALPLVAVDALGRRPTDNPSVDPLDYTANLVTLLVSVLALAAAWTALRAVRHRRVPRPDRLSTPAAPEEL